MLQYFLIWYSIGFVSIIPLQVMDIKKRGKVTIGDIFMVFVFSCLGPIITVVTIGEYFDMVIKFIEYLDGITIWKRKENK